MLTEFAVLSERDGYLFVKWSMTSLTEPKLISHWWPIGVRFADFAHRFPTPEEARARVGCVLRGLGGGNYCDESGLTYLLQEGEKTCSAYVEVTNVPEPRQRGRKLPVAWRSGAWYKQTSKGWVLA